MRYYDQETIKSQKELIKSGEVLKEDALIPPLDGRFNPYKYFKHEVYIEPSPEIQEDIIIDKETVEKIKKESAVIPYSIPAERSYAIVELQDLTSERRITNLLYDAVYEGIPISDVKIGLEIISLRILDAVKNKADKIVLTDADVLPNRVHIPLVFVLPFAESILKENGLDFSSISIFVETHEVVNPFEVATLLSLGVNKVYTGILEDELIPNVNRYVLDLIKKKGYHSLKDYINSKDIKVVGLKEEFLDTINLHLKPIFEMDGLTEIEGYLFSEAK